MPNLSKIYRYLPFSGSIYNRYVFIREYIGFIRNYYYFKKINSKRFRIEWNKIYPCLFDKRKSSEFDHHYVYHTAWAARVLARTKPKQHTDISSNIYFNAIASAFIPINFYEFRPATLELGNLKSYQADLLALKFKNNSIKSMSCMHVLEHIGLGRYGDPIDPEGDIKAIEEIKRVVASTGNLITVVPLGKPVLRFNAHRIYSYNQIIDYFKGFDLREFALVTDSAHGNRFIINAARNLADDQDYGCGCFWFIKK